MKNGDMVRTNISFFSTMGVVLHGKITQLEDNQSVKMTITKQIGKISHSLIGKEITIHCFHLESAPYKNLNEVTA